LPVDQIKIGMKALGLTKAVRGARFQMKTVLTLDPFNYVDLWLRREHHEEALYYWRQARDFHRASQGLSIESAPLVLYYCFMNAAKALLAAKGVAFSPMHGVGHHRMRGPNSKVVLSNEGIAVKTAGIVPALINYFGEAEVRTNHSLEDVLYNLVFVHRTYCLSHANARERFLPLKGATFVRDRASGEVRLLAEVVDGVDWRYFQRHLPPEVVAAPDGTPALHSATTIPWATVSKPTDIELDALGTLNAGLRRVLHYINGAHTLWYLKSTGTYEIDRTPITLTLAAMHRLSEICRYKPSDLRSFLDGQKNWLLSEFVTMASSQFLDEIACEMTGHQIMIPNVRMPV
jgi:hypothetical protein